jgi:hypothetical protein
MDHGFLPARHSLTNFFSSSPVSFFALASFSQRMAECFTALVAAAPAGAAEPGVAVGVLAAKAAPVASSAATVNVESSFMGILQALRC